jgi:hypothetical protein
MKRREPTKIINPLKSNVRQKEINPDADAL